MSCHALDDRPIPGGPSTTTAPLARPIRSSPAGFAAAVGAPVPPAAGGAFVGGALVEFGAGATAPPDFAGSLFPPHAAARHATSTMYFKVLIIVFDPVGRAARSQRQRQK